MLTSWLSLMPLTSFGHNDRLSEYVVALCPLQQSETEEQEADESVEPSGEESEDEEPECDWSLRGKEFNQIHISIKSKRRI